MTQQKGNWTYINAPCNWTRLTKEQRTFIHHMFEGKLHIDNLERGILRRVLPQLIKRNMVQTVGGFVEWTRSAYQQLAGYMRDDNMPDWIRNLADINYKDFENKHPETVANEEREVQLAIVPDFLAEKNSRIAKLESVVSTLQSRIDTDAAYMNNLEAQVAKLEADLASAKEIIVQAGKQVEKKSRSLLDALEANVTLRKENEALSGLIAESPIVEALSKQVQDLQVHLSFILGYAESAANSASNPKREYFRDIAKRCENALNPLPTEAPDAAQAVTLSESEIEWLAIWQKSDCVYHFNRKEKTPLTLKMKLEPRYIEPEGYSYYLLPEYRSDANFAAIAQRRTTLAQS